MTTENKFSKRWTCTDPGCKQYGRQLSENVYEFKDEVTEVTKINLADHDEGYKEIIINHYGYTLEPTNEFYTNIQELYPDYQWIIAECIFEMEQ